MNYTSTTPIKVGVPGISSLVYLSSPDVSIVQSSPEYNDLSAAKLIDLGQFNRYEHDFTDCDLVISDLPKDECSPMAARTQFFGPTSELCSLELERNFQDIPGIQTPSVYYSGSDQNLIRHIDHAPDQGMIKIIGKNSRVADKMFSRSYRSREELLFILCNLLPDDKFFDIRIEEHVDFVQEISIGGFFTNGAFLRPYHLWYEYKRPHAGNIGPNDKEAGVVMEICPDTHPLVQKLKMIEHYLLLSHPDFHGYFDANFLITRSGQALLVDVDARFPAPGIAALSTHNGFIEMCNHVANPDKNRRPGNYVLPKWSVCTTVWMHKNRWGSDLVDGDLEPIACVKPFLGLEIPGFPKLVESNAVLPVGTRFHENTQSWHTYDNVLDWGSGGVGYVVGRSEWTLALARKENLANLAAMGSDLLVYRNDIGEGL